MPSKIGVMIKKSYFKTFTNLTEEKWNLLDSRAKDAIRAVSEGLYEKKIKKRKAIKGLTKKIDKEKCPFHHKDTANLFYEFLSTEIGIDSANVFTRWFRWLMRF